MFELIEEHLDGKNGLARTISNELGENLITSMKELGNNMRCHYLFQIVKRNLAELVFYIQLQQNETRVVDAIECNRLLFNFVDTFYSYINFYESNYKELFKNVKKHLYDTYFEYRFIYRLRNYIVHEDLAVLKTLKKFCRDHVEVIFEVDNNALSHSPCFPQSFKQELKKRSTQMTSLNDILSNFYTVLVELHVNMLVKIWENLKNAFMLLMDNIPNKQEVYLVQNKKIINGLLNVATKYYKCVSDCFVYTENLLHDENIDKFYRDISFLYYNDESIFYVGKHNA